VDTDKWILKFLSSQLNTEEQCWNTNISDFKTYSRATVVKIVEYWQKKIQIDPWNKNREPRNRPSKYNQLISERNKDNTWSKVSLFNKGYWNNWTSTCKNKNKKPPKKQKQQPRCRPYALLKN
jgi:hypothetical protein